MIINEDIYNEHIIGFKKHPRAFDILNGRPAPNRLCIQNSSTNRTTNATFKNCNHEWGFYLMI